MESFYVTLENRNIHDSWKKVQEEFKSVLNFITPTNMLNTQLAQIKKLVQLTNLYQILIGWVIN